MVLPLPEGEGGVRGKATLEQVDVSALNVTRCCHPQARWFRPPMGRIVSTLTVKPGFFTRRGK
jgi:hypothetical protein